MITPRMRDARCCINAGNWNDSMIKIDYNEDDGDRALWGLVFKRVFESPCEEYDVVDTFGKPIGRVQLCAGNLRCWYPATYGKEIYCQNFFMPSKNEFCTEEERIYFLDTCGYLIRCKFMENLFGKEGNDRNHDKSGADPQ